VKKSKGQGLLMPCGCFPHLIQQLRSEKYVIDSLCLNNMDNGVTVPGFWARKLVGPAPGKPGTLSILFKYCPFCGVQFIFDGGNTNGRGTDSGKADYPSGARKPV